MLFRESGFAKVKRILWGDVPSIKTVGILTANNPNGMLADKAQNKQYNKNLYDYLRMQNYGPIKTKGKFGPAEDTFLVPNIGKNELITLGRQYHQVSVIFGEKQLGEDGLPFFRFYYIESESGETTSTRDVHISNAEVQGRDDFYTSVKGRKFIIPFFDDPFADKQPADLRAGNVKKVPSATPMRKAESFFIPFFDNPDQSLDCGSGVNEITYYSNKLSPESQQYVKKIRECEEKLAQPDKGDKYYWMYRGVIREMLKAINS